MSPRRRLARSDEEHKRQEEEYADSHVDVYHREMHLGPWPAYRRRLEQRLFVHLPQPDRVLDVGAGPVPSLLGVLEKARRYVAVDQSEECLRRLRAAYPGVETVRGDAEVLAVEGPFDLVLMLGVLHHLPCPNRAVDRALELMSPGGILVCMEPNEQTEAFMDSPNERGIADEAFGALLGRMQILERWAWFDVTFWTRLMASKPSRRWECPEEWVAVVDAEVEEIGRAGRGSMNFAVARKREGIETS